MPETAENVAEVYGIDRTAQDAFALRSQQRAAAAQSAGISAQEIAATTVPAPKGEARLVVEDEHASGHDSRDAREVTDALS